MTTSNHTTPESSASSQHRFEQYRQQATGIMDDDDDEKLSYTSGLDSDEDEQHRGDQMHHQKELASRNIHDEIAHGSDDEETMDVDNEEETTETKVHAHGDEEDDDGEDAEGEPTLKKTEDGKIKTSFPQTRIKAIMKADKDLQTISADGVFAVTVATELFLEVLAQESLDYTKQESRKTVAYKDVAAAVNDIQEFEFLTDVVPHTIPFKEALQRRAALLESQTSNAVAIPAESAEPLKE